MTPDAGHDAPLLGIGLYTAGDAERLVRVPAQRIRRWLLGHTFRHEGQTRRSEPLWRPQPPRLGREAERGFRDLMELRFVDAFQESGVSLHAIRRALADVVAAEGSVDKVAEIYALPRRSVRDAVEFERRLAA